MTVSEQLRQRTAVDILLIEDNPGDIRLTQEAFDESPIANTLHVVNDGVDALAFLNKRGDYEDVPRPDLILLDLNLPRKNGDEFLEELHETAPRLARIPVIVLTSSQAEEDIVTSYELQANAYLTKPVDPSEFIATIQSFEEFWIEVARLPSPRDTHD
ncbi:chemotaxis protein CheY [Halorubrum saccharovorum]|uniref:Chemotaxis protein CheY n=1 Tax=Halorubrum saccharovorum TaxID=2248 RepID=A0A0F8D5E1_9EURY|nr:response regulator [Halorubrum saccharovorum]KKF39524.1 chemotaxis protein CheY [Halorubrum saccharovorum]